MYRDLEKKFGLEPGLFPPAEEEEDEEKKEEGDEKLDVDVVSAKGAPAVAEMAR